MPAGPRLSAARRRVHARTHVRAPLAGDLARTFGALALRALVGIAAGTAVAVLALAVDAAVGWSLPVEPGRAIDLLVTLTGASLTLAVFALWMRSIVVGLVSSEFHTRTIAQFLDDGFQRATAGWMIGGFSVLVTVTVGAPGADSGVTPPLATLLALATLVAALLGILLAVRQAAERLDTSDLVHQVAERAFHDLDATQQLDDEPAPPAGQHVARERITADELGWIRNVDRRGLVALLPAGAHAELTVAPGDFVSPGTTLLTVDAPIDEATERALRDTVPIGRTRAASSDISWSIEELADVASSAVSNGDGATAREVIRYLEAFLVRLVDEGVPSGNVRDGDRLLTCPAQPTVADHVARAARQLRRASSDPESAHLTEQLLERLAYRATDRGDHAAAAAARDGVSDGRAHVRPVADDHHGGL